MTVPECLWNNTISFSCYWIHLARAHKRAHKGIHASKRRRLRSAIRKVKDRGRREDSDSMIRDYANSVTCTLQRDRCTFKVNVGSADLSYGGCTIWHNSRTHTRGTQYRYVDTRCSLWERAEYLSRKCRRSRKSY